ncbi:hypothetical protein ACFV0O_28700 [Kitasatospora sp. NPDC059577]|uniref:hypothetical protein n=1 Tax=Kitasatospora sp. NPDC059577 TaxID=3346873 RepID=UPI003694DAD6
MTQLTEGAEALFAYIRQRKLSGGIDRSRAQLARRWRECPTEYTVSHAIEQAALEQCGDGLLADILDGEFRRLRREWTGVNGLRADLYAARTYFLTQEPDLIRYLQVLFLEQRPPGSPESRSVQEQHCRAYADFLQLDRLPQERTGGLDGVLRRFFPDKDPDEASDDAHSDRLRLRLVGYELGEWQCSCGRLTGFARRYEHTCPCGATTGQSRIDATASPCPDCGEPVAYSHCPDCRTRVTLANLWRVKRGGTRPTDYLLPLTVDLVLEGRHSTISRTRDRLMLLPLPIGLYERDGEPGFGPPAIFWESGVMADDRDRPEGNRFIALKDALDGDGRTTFASILDSALRVGESRAALAEDLIRDLIQPSGESARRFMSHTRGFWRGLGRAAVPGLRVSDLVGLGAVSFQCTVTSSARLHGKAALLSTDHADPRSLTVPRLQQLQLSLPTDAELSASPTDMSAARTASLEECGLAAPGSQVKPGQLLVGAVAPMRKGTHLRPEERLLEQVFGEGRVLRPRCLVMPGERPGTVLDQQLTGPLATDAVPAVPGRHLDPGQLLSDTHVSVTIAVDQALQHGDTLDDEVGDSVIVCGFGARPAPPPGAADPCAPHLVVAPDHPWAPPPGQSARTIRVHLTTNQLASSDTGAWSAGGVTMILRQPPRAIDGVGAQVIEPAEVRWLIDNGARHLAMEIYGPRSDCADWHTELRGALETTGHGPLAPPRDRPVAFESAVSHGIRRLDLTLRAARLVPRLGPDGITLAPMTDSEVAAGSHGEVRQEWPFEVRTGRPRTGGLFCQDIFGQDRHDECVCGRHHNPKWVGRSCEDCGRTLTSPLERSHRFGHLELPATVVHSWFLRGRAAERLAEALNVTVDQLCRVADCELLLVTDPGRTALRSGQLVTADEWFGSLDRYGASAVTGGSAVEALLRQAVEPPGPPADAIAIRRLPVLPPDLRPFVLEESGPVFTSDLNPLYRAVMLAGEALVRQQNSPYGTERRELEIRRRLQRAVDRLLGPRTDASAPDSLADSLTVHHNPAGPLRDDLLRRSVNYSARARIVAGRVPGPEEDAAAELDTVVLGRELALRLLEPVLVHALTASGAAEDPRRARALIDKRADTAHRLLDTVCERARILVAFPQSHWPLVTLRLRAAEASALEVHPALLDLLGWQNLGESARIFAILSDEANREAADHLTITALRSASAGTTPRPAGSGSLFDLPCEGLADRLADTAMTAASLPLAPDDGLLLCELGWLSDGGRDPAAGVAG